MKHTHESLVRRRVTRVISRMNAITSDVMESFVESQIAHAVKPHSASRAAEATTKYTRRRKGDAKHTTPSQKVRTPRT